MSKIIITRHQGLVDYLIYQGLVSKDTKVISHATPDQVRGKDVIGVLPMDLAVLARSVTIVPLNLPQNLRGVDLTVDQVAQYAGTPRTFSVYDRDTLSNLDQKHTLDDGGQVLATLDDK